MTIPCNGCLGSVALLLCCSVLFASACSSARLDPNTRALTFVALSRDASGGASADGERAAQNQKPSPRMTGSLAGAGGVAVSSSASQATTDPSPKSTTCSDLPDPAPTQTKQWVAVTVRYAKGVLDVAAAKSRSSRSAETTKRRMGRFAAELWIGCELIDRVRFDFPMLASKPDKAKAHEPEFVLDGPFEAMVTLPESERATRLEIVDRDHETRRRFDWPLRL